MRFLRRALCSIALLTASTLSAAAQVNYTTNVTQANLLAGGTPVPSAKVCAYAVDQYGNPVTFSAPTWGLVLANTPFCGTVTSGAITGGINVPDANHTNQPSPLHYNFVIQLLSSGVPTGPPISLVNVPNVSGTTYSLDSYAPTTSGVIPASNVLASGSGVPSSCTAPSLTVNSATSQLYFCNGGVYNVIPAPVFNLRGAWAASTAYSVFDVFTYNGSSYVVTTAFTSGSTFSAANTMLLAQGGGLVSSANLNSANSQVQVDSVASSVYYGLDCFGDSYMAGTGSQQTPGQCGIVASEYNMPTPNNYAVAGDNSGDFAWHVFTSLNPADSGNPMVIAASSQNNTNCGVTTACLQYFNRTYYAGFTWGSLSSSKKILFSGNYAVAATGTSSTDTTFSNANGVNCTAGPCTFTNSFIVGQPGIVYLWYIMRSTGGTISVTIDGSTATDTVTGLTSLNTAWGGFSPQNQTATVGMARFAASSASPGTHTIVVTASTGAVVIGIGLPTVSRYRGVAAPRMVMGGTHQKPGTTGSLTTTYNGASLAIQQTLVSDGLDVPFTDLYNAYNPNLDFISNYYTASQSGTTLTVSAVNGSNTGTITLGQPFYYAGSSTVLGTVTAFGTGTGGVGTYTLNTSATVASGTFVQSTQGCFSSTTAAHPNDCGHIDAAHAWEANLNAAPVPIQGLPAGSTTVSGPLYGDNPGVPASLSLGTHFRPHTYSDTLLTGVDVAPQNAGAYFGIKYLLYDPVSGLPALIQYLTDTGKEVAACWANTANPTSDAAFTSCPWHVTSAGNVYAAGTVNFAGTGTHTFGGTLKATALQSNNGVCLYSYSSHCINPSSGNTDTFTSNGIVPPQATVSTLPSGVPAGTQVIVTNSASATPGTCTGTGSYYMIGIYNGSTWYCH